MAADVDITAIVTDGEPIEVTVENNVTTIAATVADPNDTFSVSVVAGAPGANGAPGQGVPVGGTAGQILSKINGTDYATQWIAASGTGTVTAVSVTTANGVSGSVATSTTTPAITIALGAITPSSVNSVVLSGSSTPTLAVTGTTAVSGTNTGDQTSVTGNAGTATTLQTGRTIGTATGDVTSTGSTFNGSAANTNAYTLATVNSNVGTFTKPSVTVNGKGLITAISSGTADFITSITTTGTSGAASVSSGVLNIPQYAGATYAAGTGLTLTTGTFSVNTSQNIAKLSNLTTNGFVKTSASDGTLSVDTSTYLTGNQTVTLSGDITGSGATAITTTYNNVVPASKGGAGTISGLLKANGSGTVSAAVSSTDYAPATSGSALLKGNGSGGFSSAVANTDYQSPVSLTTTGTSGNATFSANVFNIPNYTYTLPTASTSVLGGVKVDGTSILISSGVISAVSGGSGTVTTVSSANAHATIANPTSTPAITIVSSPAVNSITAQTAHGFSVGNSVRYNGTAYVTAKADTAANADVEGIVTTVVDANNFIYTNRGYSAGFTGLTAGADYFLDPTTAGAYTTTAPSTVGQVVKFLFKALSTTTVMIHNGNSITVTASGTGDVVGPSSATDNSLPVFDGTTGKLLKANGTTATAILVNSSNNTLLVPTKVSGAGNNFGIQSGGTTDASLAAGILYLVAGTNLGAGAGGTVQVTGGTSVSGQGGDVVIKSGSGVGSRVRIGYSQDVTKVITFDSSAATTGTATTLTSVQTANRAITFPDATDTLMGKATTDTFTNKTYDTAGTGNSFSINGLAATANTGTGAVVRATSPALTTPNLGTPSAITLTSATGLPISTGVSGLGTGIATFLATPSSANLITAVTDETGSGALVFASTPTLVTPVLGVATATSINKVTITAPTTSATLTLVTGSSLITAGAFATTLTSTATTNATLPAGTNTLYSTLSGSITSAQLATSLTDETGSGANVFATSPTLVTPALGTPSALVLTNATGLPVAALPTGVVVQTVSTNFSAVATGTTLFPNDDTIPQITEGNEFMTQAITPLSTTNKLTVFIEMTLSGSVASAIEMGLWQDATANALAATNFYQAAAGGLVNLKLMYSMTAGTTSATTFRVRGGMDNVGTVTFNGIGGARRYGGLGALSNVTIIETKA